MSQIRPFGFTAYKHYKKRLAKKFINSNGRAMWKRYHMFHNYSGLISDCSGLNAKPTSIEPYYVFRRNGRAKVLFDLDISSNTNSCSFFHCGIDRAKTYKECQKYIQDIINYWSQTDDSYGFAERYSKIKLNLDGTFTWT